MRQCGFLYHSIQKSRYKSLNEGHSLLMSGSEKPYRPLGSAAELALQSFTFQTSYTAHTGLCHAQEL